MALHGSLRFVALVSGLAMLLRGQAAPPDLQHELSSPDKRLAVHVRLPEPGSKELPRWSATLHGKPLLQDCRLGLVLAGPLDLLAGAHTTVVERRVHDERIAVLFGKADHARDHFAELRLTLQRAGSLPIQVVLRCFDDAIAFRYEVPVAPAQGPLRLVGEATSFRFVGEPTVYAQYLAHFRTSHEHPVNQVALPDLAVGKLLDLPLTAAFVVGPFVSITEAALRHYAGMSLRREPGTRDLVAVLTPRADGIAVERPLPLVTPWRVVLVGDRAGALLESNTLYCLNDPPAFDTSWIKPGKLTWPWWNNYLFEAARGEPILSLATSKQHLDWCAEHGIAFHAVVADETDTPWYVQPKKGLFPGPGTDATRVRADLDLAAIKAYATKQGVGLWTWVHHGAVRGRTEEVFAAFARLGWNGVMVDFLDHDDQDTVEFAEEVLAAAARHHVLVHFHGMYKPSGTQRTFPNLMNHEGSLNLEYLKWSASCTPEHTLRVAFTRLVAGPMDYHLGGFRAVLPAQFQPKNVGPNVLGTRCHQLAMYVCFDNPAPMVADYPAAYRDQPGFDFVQEVPTWWDETKVLDGQIGRLLVTARRRGNVWYVGGLAAGEAREIVLPLTFLAAGPHTQEVWRDGDDAARDPNLLEFEQKQVSATDLLRVRVGPDGGFVARFVPQN